MNKKDLLEELKNFYMIRGDENAKEFILEFIDMVSRERVPVNRYEDWFSINYKKIGTQYKESTRVTYNRILNQFIRYVIATERINLINRKKYGSHYSNKKTKIHDTFQEFIEYNS